MTRCRDRTDGLEQGQTFTAAALRVARERFEGGVAHPAVYSWGERGRRLYTTPEGAAEWPDVIDETVWQAMQDAPAQLAVMLYAVRDGDAWMTAPKGSWALVTVADLTTDAEPALYCAAFEHDDAGPLGPWFAVAAAPLH